jgi:hypothetical protein
MSTYIYFSYFIPKRSSKDINLLEELEKCQEYLCSATQILQSDAKGTRAAEVQVFLAHAASTFGPCGMLFALPDHPLHCWTVILPPKMRTVELLFKEKYPRFIMDSDLSQFFTIIHKAAIRQKPDGELVVQAGHFLLACEPILTPRNQGARL